jgi:hypothetical protein
MTGCAVVAFIPPAYFDGISTARHMAVMNFALSLAFAITAALAISMICHGAVRTSAPAAVPASSARTATEMADAHTLRKLE